MFTKELRRKSKSKGDQDARGLFARESLEKKEFKGKKGIRSKSKEGKKRKAERTGREGELQKK